MSFDERSRLGRKVKPGSNRSFGVLFVIVFGVVSLWPLWSGGAVRLWAAAVAAVFAVITVVAPQLLAALNRGWFLLGQAMHKVVNPLVMGLIYFGCVVPTGLVLKLLGKDTLRLRRDPEATSYWIVREPPGPARGSMSRQF
jgi:uncharacterized membrane protein YhaH (DUF805 family)